jgi:hypothetical protein
MYSMYVFTKKNVCISANFGLDKRQCGCLEYLFIIFYYSVFVKYGELLNNSHHVNKASHRMGDQNLLSRAPPCIERHVKPLVLAVLGPCGGLLPFLLICNPEYCIRNACAPAVGTLID